MSNCRVESRLGQTSGGAAHIASPLGRSMLRLLRCLFSDAERDARPEPAGRLDRLHLRVRRSREIVSLGAIATAFLVVGTASIAIAQQPPPRAAPAPSAPQGQDADLIYSPWAKFCGKGQDNAKEVPVCITGTESRTATGLPVTAVALIEADGDPNKHLRVTVPNPVQLQFGARIFVDKDQPQASSFFTCIVSGCLADYSAPPELVAKMKSGQVLTIQAINLAGQEISYAIPLADFKKANEGPASDPKVIQEQNNKPKDDGRR